YALLTRMHERYLFLSLACLAPLAVLRPLRLALAGLSGLFVLNLWYPYAFFNSQWKVDGLRYNPWFDWTFGGFETDTWQKKVWSLALAAIAILVAWRGMRWVQESRPSRKPTREAAAVAASPLARGTPSPDEATHLVPAKSWARWVP